MKVIIFALLLLPLILGAGTLIYKNKDNEERIISNATIMSMDGKHVVIKVNNGTETISLGRVVKYFNSNIKGGDFDDNTAEYTVRIGDAKVTRGDKKRSATQAEMEISYSVDMKIGETEKYGVRFPYFYLFVLTGNSDGGRSVLSYAYPAKAKISQSSYDEARMMEKVVALDRQIYYPEDRDRLGQKVRRAGVSMGGNRVADFKLNGIKNGNVIAWHLVVWGKDKVVATKTEWVNRLYREYNNWWLR